MTLNGREEDPQTEKRSFTIHLYYLGQNDIHSQPQHNIALFATVSKSMCKL